MGSMKRRFTLRHLVVNHKKTAEKTENMTPNKEKGKKAYYKALNQIQFNICAHDNNQPMRATLIMLQLSREKVNNNTQKVMVIVICMGA
jgi:hypothetical protein